MSSDSQGGETDKKITIRKIFDKKTQLKHISAKVALCLN